MESISKGRANKYRFEQDQKDNRQVDGSLEPVVDACGFPVKIEDGIQADYLRFREVQMQKGRDRNKRPSISNASKDVEPFSISNTAKFDKKRLKAWADIGVPIIYKAEFWGLCSGSIRKKENANVNSESGSYYLELVQKNIKKGKILPASLDIERDINRTFPEHPIYRTPEGKERLRTVLNAYARRNKAIGYCQGLNFVCGWVLLFVSDDEEAFWLLCTIIEDLCPGFYSKNMITIQISHRILDEFIQEKLPELYTHMVNLRVSLPLITIKWFLLLFVDTLPPETVLEIWDHFLLEGWPRLFSTALALLKMHEEILLKSKSATELMDLLEDRCKRIFNSRKLSKLANKMEISEARLEELRLLQKRKVENEVEEFRQKRDIRDLANLTHFSQEQLKQMRAQFKFLATEEALRDKTGKTIVFNFDQFAKTFCHIFKGVKPDDPAIMRLFKAFASNGDKMVDFKELMIGLSIFTQGSLDQKLDLCLKSVDLNDSGYITKEEMLSLLMGVYKNVYRQEDQTLDLLSLKQIFELMENFVEMTFTNLDSGNIGKISFEDFKKSIILEPKLVECFLMELPSVKRDEGTIFTLTDNSLEELSSPKEISVPNWQPDKDAASCPICTKQFGTFKRKHHCRFCGKVVCGRCSDNFQAIPEFGYDNPVRICDKCFPDVRIDKGSRPSSPRIERKARDGTGILKRN